ncbi:MAG: hypothetical protein KDC10_03190 [Calditrichaeota bacterium]|nr:hypothetical protein [Calditrichota bacterium]MCB9474449.1 hypothetical protein [Candidatus Delongbacteria bacterium]
MLFTSLSWVLFSQGAETPVHLLPFAGLIIETAALMLIFVYRSSELMRSYLMRIEVRFNALFSPSCARHVVDGQTGPTLALGCTLWRQACSRSGRGRHGFVLAAIAGGLVTSLALAGFVFAGLASPVLGESTFRIPLVLLLVALPLAGGLLFVRLRRDVLEERAHMLAACLDLSLLKASENELGPGLTVSLLETDHAERCTDFRTHADSYPRLLVLTLMLLASSAGILNQSAANRWIFLVTPPILLALTLAMVLEFRRIKHIKRYLGKCESWMDSIASSALEPVHSLSHNGRRIEFRIGFFRIVRERRIARTSGALKGLPAGNLLIASAALLTVFLLIGFSVRQAHLWACEVLPQQATLVTLGNLILLSTLLLANAVMFLTAGRVGRDPDTASTADE